MHFLLKHVAYCMTNDYVPAVFYFHIPIAAMYLIGLFGYYDVHRKTYNGTPEEYGGFSKFLSFWNIVSHFLFFALSSVIDIVTPECCAYDSIVRIRDTVFAGIVFPFGTFVFLMFWSIYISNRDKIFPKQSEQHFPAWLIHVSHTVTLPVVLLEAFMVHHRYPDKLEGLILTATFGGTYLIWLLYLGIVRDIWVYIFLKYFNRTERARFFSVSFLLGFIFYVVGEKTNHLFWGDHSLSSQN